MSDSKCTHSESHSFFSAARTVAAVTLLSRVFGLARDMMLSRFLGASGMTSDFWTAFSIPNFFRRLFGEGALSAAFVPVFSETQELEGSVSAGKLLANVLAVLTMLLCGLLIVVELGIICTWAWLQHSARLEGASYSGLIPVTLAIMMPFMVTICLVALASAALNCVGRFAVAAAAPIVLNIVIITFTVVVTVCFEGERERLIALAFAMPTTGLLQMLLLGTALRKAGLPIRPRLRPILPGVKRIAVSMGPMMIPLGVLQINALLDKVIARTFSVAQVSEDIVAGGVAGGGAHFSFFGFELARPLAAESVTWMNFGERLYQFPMGVLAISLATAVFPLFSRYAARGDTVNLRLSVNRALRLAIFEGLPSGIGLMVLGGPLVAAIFGGNKYTPHDVAETAHVTFFYGLGMWAFCSHHILLRAFYAIGDRLTPLRIALCVVGVNFLLNISLIWIPGIRHGAFGLGSSITQSLNVLVLIFVLRKKLSGGSAGSITSGLLISVLRTAICASIMAVAISGVVRLLDGRNRIIIAGCGAVVGALVFAAAAWLLRAPELREVISSGSAKDRLPDEKASGSV